MKQNLSFRSEPFCRPLTTIAALSGERFNFEFESPFGKSENSFQIFESLDYEAMAGSIPERDYLRWVQFRSICISRKAASVDRSPRTERLRSASRCVATFQY